jgi:hypothetical protein
MINYKELEWLDERRKFRKVGKHGRFGVKKTKGDLICKIRYNKISPFVDGIAIVEYKKFFSSKILLGILTTEGKEILFDENYKRVVVLNRNVIAVKIQIDEDKSEWAIVNSKGIEMYGIRYEDCPEPFVNGFSKVRRKNGWTFINEKGRHINSTIYSRVSNFRKSGKAFVWLRDKRYVLRKDGIEE